MLEFCCRYCSVSVVSRSLQPRELQPARLPCPSPPPRLCSNSCLLGWWCHPTISSSVTPFPPALSLSQHQGLSPWVGSSHQVTKWMSSTIHFCVPWCRCGWLSLRYKPNGSWYLHLRICMTPWCWGEVEMFSPLTLSGASLPCRALSLLCSQLCPLSLVVQGPNLRSHLSGTMSILLIILHVPGSPPFFFFFLITKIVYNLQFFHIKK